MYTYLILWFNPLNTHVHTLVIKLYKAWNSYCNTTSQPVFISFTTYMARPFLKLKCFILLVMYCWLKGFYCEMNGKLLK